MEAYGAFIGGGWGRVGVDGVLLWVGVRGGGFTV